MTCHVYQIELRTDRDHDVNRNKRELLFVIQRNANGIAQSDIQHLYQDIGMTSSSSHHSVYLVS